MSEPIPRDCPHDLRPGTTVCLRCRKEARAVAQARTRRNAIMIGVPAFVVVVLGAMVAIRLTARPAQAAASAPAKQEVVVAPPPVVPAVDSVRPKGPPIPPLTPKIAQGRTALGDGMFAERSDTGVTVYFDSPMTRTRRADKFERIVRLTLPVIFGPTADSVLAAVPNGALAGGADLLTELPSRGVHLPLPDGWALDLWPSTRVGRDGPLVVNYRAAVTLR
jgi:hypothetical protein